MIERKNNAMLTRLVRPQLTDGNDNDREQEA